MLNWSKFFVFTSIFLIAGVGYGQLFTEDFESGSGGFTISPAGATYTDGAEDYLIITNGVSGIASAMSFTGIDGSFLGAHDLDGDGEASPQILTWSGISISGCAGLSFSIDAAEDDDGSNEDWDANDFVRIDYSIDGGAYSPLIWIENDGSTYNSAPFIDSDFDGTGDASEITSTFQTFTNVISGTGSTLNIRITIDLDAGDEDIALDNLIITGACGGTITASSISGDPFTVDCAGPTPASGTFSFTSSGSFNAGNVFSAELSDGTVLGTLTSSGANPSGAISITVPANLATGNYDVLVTSSDPVSTSNNLTFSLIQNCEPPHLNSLVLNSCNTVCDEGNNEVIFGSSGDYSVTLNSANLTVTYGSSVSPTTDYTDPFVSNSAKTNSLNTDAGCSGLFLDGLNVTVAPNSKFMIISNDFCSGDGLDLSSLCGSGPIYVLYSNDPSWSSSGNFTNSTSAGIRYLQSSISTTSALFIIDYSFDSGLNSGADGDYVKWNSTGGLASEVGNNGCTLSATLLPIELTEFNGFLRYNSVMLTWTTLSELNNDYFSLYHSMNGKVFEELGTFPGSGTTSSSLNYSFEHRNPRPGFNYYKLKSVDYNGTLHEKGIIAVQVEMNLIFYNKITRSIQMNYKSDYAVYGSDGRLITRVEQQNAIPFEGFGVFHVIDERSGESFKLGVY